MTRLGLLLVAGAIALGTAPSAQAARAPCTITGTSGDDELRGTSGADVICGRGGDDRIYGGAGSDRITGDRGRDVIDGGPGDDTIFGNLGDDVIDGGPGDDRINVVGGGRDIVRCGRGIDSVHADPHDRVAPDCERISR